MLSGILKLARQCVSLRQTFHWSASVAHLECHAAVIVFAHGASAYSGILRLPIK